MTIRAVIFDLGGVLVRTEDPQPRQKLAERLGMTLEELYVLFFESETARLATLGQATQQQHVEKMRAALGVSPEAFEQIWEQFWAGDRVDYELVNRLRALRGRCATALLSNAWDTMRAMVEQTWKFDDAFDLMVISAEVGLAKPDERIYRYTVERLGLQPQECIFVDDFSRNVNAAREFGLQAIHFKSAQQAWGEVERFFVG
jgi:epoxide hydrolase-like predicted phosphatase